MIEMAAAACLTAVTLIPIVAIGLSTQRRLRRIEGLAEDRSAYIAELEAKLRYHRIDLPRTRRPVTTGTIGSGTVNLTVQET